MVHFNAKTQMKLIRELLEIVDAGFERFMKDTIKDKPTGKMSIMKAFGSDEYNELHDMGIRFFEKPDWNELEQHAKQHPLTDKNIERVEQKLGVPFKIYTQDKIFGPGKGRSRDPSSKDGWWPMSDANIPPEPVFIVHMEDGTKYLCDGTQSRSYIRMWAKID